MGIMGWNGSNHLDRTSPYQLPYPLLGGVARPSFSEGGTGWVCFIPTSPTTPPTAEQNLEEAARQGADDSSWLNPQYAEQDS
jgi:hypothetical protein